MKFLLKNECYKSIVVISDIHLGAGRTVYNRKNFLEDFHSDKEFVEFIEYHSDGYFINREVELIINGDFFDLLAVPFVKYFDDEFWSEEAALSKLKMIIEAHHEIMSSLVNFISFPTNKITYILGNHDSEMILPKLQEYLLNYFPLESRERFTILTNENSDYRPIPGIVIKHGHEYEIAHQFSSKLIAEDESGTRYFIPPWGSYYVTRVINKFKEGRDYINAVRPVNKFIINGLIYDTLYTLRFMFSNITYFLMVRFLMLFKVNNRIKEIVKSVKMEMQLFKDYESMTEDFIKDNPEVKALIVGHTHDPIYREYDDGSIFINTGTWTKMYNLDFGKNFHGQKLTFARIDLVKNENEKEDVDISLNEWKGRSLYPFREFR